LNPGSAEDDRELAAFAARTGDARALADLYARHRERLLLIIRQRLGWRLRRRLDSEDILQSAFVDAVRDWPSAGPGEAFLPWVAQVIERAIRDRARGLFRKKRDARRDVSVGGELPPVAAAGASPSEVATRAEELARFERALNRLSARDRELVLLAKVEGRSAEEVAELLALTREAAKRAITRAVARLAAIMAGDD
jgi:RNA polymerase sigma-70 factor (ECF subfamily)